MNELLERVNVIHVDDDPDLADMVADFLEQENESFDVETAMHVSDAMEIVDDDIDCVISDYEMPEQNGIEFLESVRAEYPNLPFILYTGKGSEEIASVAISAGVTDYLQKETGTSQYTVLANRVSNAVEQYRSQRAVAQTEQKLAELAEKTDDVLYIFSGAWDELLFINSAYEDIWGGSIAELKTDPESFLEHVHPNDREKAIESMDRLATGKSDKIEYRVVRPDGETRWVSGDSKPVRDAEGNVVRIVGFVRDITEHKEHEQELERVRDLLHRTEQIADVGGWEIDTKTMEVFWTKHLFDILGVDYDEEPPLDEALDVYHEEDRSIVENAVQSALDEGEPFDVEVRFEQPEGDIRWVRVIGLPTIDDGKIVTLRGAVQDITERKERERQLERKNDRLEEFARVLSHDIRNPLNVAQGRLDIAREIGDNEHLAAVDRAQERIGLLIDNLHSLAREGEEVGELEPVELADLAETCWQNVATGEATLVTQNTGSIRADRSRLQQVLENLIRNAIEHADENVSVTIGEYGDGFYVEDDGPGIPEVKREEIFDAGYSTSKDGTGFGLSIVKQVVTAHGWEINMTEGTDSGARFEIRGVEFTDG